MRYVLTALLAVVLVCIAVAAPQEEQPGEEQISAGLERLQSEDLRVRRAAKAEIRDIYQSLGGELEEPEQVRQLPEYQALVAGLIAIVAKERDRYDDFDEKLLAVQLLGQMRAPEAVEALLDNMLEPIPMDILEWTLESMNPCVDGLIRIGEPSVQGILRRLDRAFPRKGGILDWMRPEHREKWVPDLYSVIIRNVRGKDGAATLLDEELKKARTRQANLQEMMGLLD
jgi:hypothetical protein